MVIDNVEKIRKIKGFTKTYIAHKLGLSLQGYRHIVNGDVRLDVERLKKLSDILSVPTCIFFDNKLTKSVILEIENQFMN